MRLPRVRFTVRTLMIVVAAAAILFVWVRVVERWRQLNKAAQARYAASLQLYQVTEALWRGGEVGVQTLYLHSRMVVEAQREWGDPAWASDHLKRMRAIEKVVKASPVTDCPNPQADRFVDFMVKEAEYWALRDSW
jgi:hypothetical protein